jgi:predicted Na+-dependent transporter
MRFSLEGRTWAQDLRTGSIPGAVWAVIRYLIILVLVPIAVGYIYGRYTGDGSLLDKFKNLLLTYIVLVWPLILIAIPIGFYPEGNRAKIPFRLIQGVYAALMLLIWTNWGSALPLEVNNIWLGDKFYISSLNIEIRIKSLIYIFAACSVIQGLLGFLECSAGLKDYRHFIEDRQDRKNRKKIKRNGGKADPRMST